MKTSKNNYLKESLLDFDSLSKSLKESTSETVRAILGEAVRETYNKILTEDEEEKEDDYEIEEVDDTESENSNGTEETEEVSSEEVVDDTAEEETSEAEEGAADSFETADDSTDAVEGAEVDEEEGADGDEWSEFDSYKVSDDTYDLSDAEDEDVVKVYKLLKDTDQVLVNVDKESNKVEIKDNETGNEYLIDLGSSNDGENTLEDDFGGEEDDFSEMNEQRIFEIALNEYDSNVGYTDNYQKKDVMTNPGMSEPGKNVNDWDAGVPKGSSKPWAKKGDDAPFNAGEGKKVEECGNTQIEEEDEMLDEAGHNVGGFVQQNSTSTLVTSNSNGRHARNNRANNVAPEDKRTSKPRYSSATNESKMMAAHKAIMQENKQLKAALARFKTVLQEAAVTNVNLGQIVKLISENAVTMDEKKNIIARFGKEAKTVEQSKNLYESIANELKSNPKKTINEEKTFTANGSKQINETQIYQSKDLLESLDLMHRICK